MLFWGLWCEVSFLLFYRCWGVVVGCFFLGGGCGGWLGGFVVCVVVWVWLWWVSVGGGLGWFFGCVLGFWGLWCGGVGLLVLVGVFVLGCLVVGCCVYSLGVVLCVWGWGVVCLVGVGVVLLVGGRVLGGCVGCLWFVVCVGLGWFGGLLVGGRCFVLLGLIGVWGGCGV